MARHAFNGQLFNSDGVSVRVAISDTEAGIMLEVIGDAREFFESQLTDLTLQSTGGRGVLRTRGSGRRIDHNHIKFLLDDAGGLVQRRHFVRVISAQRFVFEDADGDTMCEGLAVNISGGGALISLPRRRERIPGLASLGTDDKLPFQLFLRDGDEPISGTCRVMRILPDERIAITFEELSRSNRDRIIRFVFDRERAAIALTRGDAG